jgi:hypothetical protein
MFLVTAAGFKIACKNMRHGRTMADPAIIWAQFDRSFDRFDRFIVTALESLSIADCRIGFGKNGIYGEGTLGHFKG